MSFGWLYNMEGKVKYVQKKKLLNLVLPYRMVCVFYTSKFSKYGLGKERVLKGERMSLAFSNQILKCMDKYTNTFLRQRKIFSVKSMIYKQLSESFFLKSLQEEYTFRIHFFFLIVWYSGCVVGNFSSFPSPARRL